MKYQDGMLVEFYSNEDKSYLCQGKIFMVTTSSTLIVEVTQAPPGLGIGWHPASYTIRSHPSPNWDKTKEYWFVDVDLITRVLEAPIPVQEKVSYPAMTCEGCGDINTYAAPNLSNGKFACYSCRTTNGWRFGL